MNKIFNQTKFMIGEVMDMERTYKVGTRRVDEGGLERMYQVLDELRLINVYNFERYIVLSACMEELAKRSKRLKALAEGSKHETGNRDTKGICFTLEER